MLQAEKLLPVELRLELWWLPVELQHLLRTASDLLRTAADLLCSGSDLLRSGPVVWRSGSLCGNRSRAGRCSRTGSQRLMS